jgi:spermidine/putrescine transport system permease protein
VLLVFVPPLVTIVVWSLWSVESRDIVRELSLANYREIFAADSVHLRVLLRTLGFGILVCALSLLIAFPVAFYIAKMVENSRRKATMILLIILPFLLGFLVRTIAWRGILGINGVVNTVLLELGVIEQPLEFLLYGPFAVVIALLYNYYPFMFFTLYIALEALDDDLIAAAFDLSASRWQTFWRVVLPLCMPGIITGTILTFVPVTAAVLEPEMLGGTGGRFMGNSIQSQFGQAFNWPMGAALSVVLMLACLLVLAVIVGLLTWRFRRAIVRSA